VKVRFAQTADEAYDFLIEHNYPYEWPLDAMRQCMCVKILTDDDEVVGYVWFEWTVVPGVLEWHVCIKEAFQRRWVTEGVIRDLHKVAELTGAKTVICMTPLPRMQRSMALLGWKLAGPFAFTNLPNKWCYHGSSCSKNRPTTSDEAAPASAAASGNSD